MSAVSTRSSAWSTCSVQVEQLTAPRPRDRPTAVSDVPAAERIALPVLGASNGNGHHADELTPAAIEEDEDPMERVHGRFPTPCGAGSKR